MKQNIKIWQVDYHLLLPIPPPDNTPSRLPVGGRVFVDEGFHTENCRPVCRLPKLSQQTRKLSQQTFGLSQQTRALSRQTPKLSQQTFKLNLFNRCVKRI
ncbi:MAG: hypothetical protein WA821_17425 [Anaerolineales bacterium]